MTLRALPLLVVALAAPCSEDRVAVLEGQKRELLEATVEKQAFWAEVERRGSATRRVQELRSEASGLEQELAGLGPRAAAVEASLAQARDTNQRAQEVLDELRRRAEEETLPVRELEATLARWRTGEPEAGR